MEQANTRLYVGNLPYVAEKAEIEELFANNGIPIKKVDMSVDPFTGRNPSYCFVEFESADVAAYAMNSMQGQEVRGRPVRINVKTERPGNAERPPRKTFDRGWRAADGAAQDEPQHVPAFDRWNRNDAQSRLQVPQEEGKRIYVGGLPRIAGQAAVDAEMQALFQGFNVEAVSKIISPHESKAAEPGSHYYCFVDLATSGEVNEAVKALDGTQTPHGGTYRVSVARERRRPNRTDGEQSGETTTTQPRVARPPRAEPRRDLSGSWRRAD